MKTVAESGLLVKIEKIIFIINICNPEKIFSIIPSSKTISKLNPSKSSITTLPEEVGKKIIQFQHSRIFFSFALRNYTEFKDNKALLMLAPFFSSVLFTVDGA